MAMKLLLTLLVLAFGSYGFAKPSEGPSVKVNIAVNTDQGSTHESAGFVNEDGKWKALKDRNSGARQMSISSRLPGILLPGVGIGLPPMALLGSPMIQMGTGNFSNLFHYLFSPFTLTFI